MTRRRSAKVAKGKTRKFVLRVKPKAHKQISQKKRLLVNQAVKVGKGR